MVRAGAARASARDVTALAIGSSDWLGSEPLVNVPQETDTKRLFAISHLPQQRDPRTSILDSALPQLFAGTAKKSDRSQA